MREGKGISKTYSTTDIIQTTKLSPKTLQEILDYHQERNGWVDGQK